MRTVMITTADNTEIPATPLGDVVIDIVQVNPAALYDGPEYEPICEDIFLGEDGNYYLGGFNSKRLTDDDVAFYMSTFTSIEEREAQPDFPEWTETDWDLPF